MVSGPVGPDMMFPDNPHHQGPCFFSPSPLCPTPKFGAEATTVLWKLEYDREDLGTSCKPDWDLRLPYNLLLGGCGDMAGWQLGSRPVSDLLDMNFTLTVCTYKMAIMM